LRSEDILIVNDGSPFLKTIGLVLAEKGYRTCVIDSPFEAVAELARKYFRLVIVKLPGKTADSPALLNTVKDLNPEARLIILGEDARLPVEAYPLTFEGQRVLFIKKFIPKEVSMFIESAKAFVEKMGRGMMRPSPMMQQ
jgi:DNA-binding NtrC family response regulator